jgi:hypothetical protein
MPRSSCPALSSSAWLEGDYGDDTAAAVRAAAVTALESRGLPTSARIGLADCALDATAGSAPGNESTASPVVVLSAMSISKTYGRRNAHLNVFERRDFHWDAIRSAKGFYNARNITTLVVIGGSVKNDIPSDLAKDAVVAPEIRGPGIADHLMLRLAMCLHCQFLENGDRFREDLLPSDLGSFLRVHLVRLRARFVFDEAGNFVPLKPPPQPIALLGGC